MLRHLGSKRTYGHNVKLAAMLSLTAGFVNAAGFLGFSVLTTNVTGHAALFAESIAMQEWQSARVIALWMSLFLGGAFVSSFIVSSLGKDQRFSFVGPVLLETVIFVIVGLTGHNYDQSLVLKEVFAGSLLFSMGMQNALVTVISGSVVRTTHLTGTFTDLGIELAQLVKRSGTDQKAIKARVKLRGVIIFFFLIGALAGAFVFRYVHFYSFFVPAGLLIYTMLYDIFRIKIKYYYRHMRRV